METKEKHIVRKIIVVTMVSLDNVMQGPGDPAEDTSEGFTLGGWTVPYVDDFFGKVLDEEMITRLTYSSAERHLRSSRLTGLSMTRRDPDPALIRQ